MDTSTVSELITDTEEIDILCKARVPTYRRRLYSSAHEAPLSHFVVSKVNPSVIPNSARERRNNKFGARLSEAGMEQGGKGRSCFGADRRTGLAIVIGSILLLNILTIIGLWQVLIGNIGDENLLSRSDSSTTRTAPTKACGDRQRGLVYNKPPKTASTFIQEVIVNWTERTGRPLYQCNRTPMLTMVNLRTCVPAEPDACGVFSCHVYLNPFALQLFNERIPGHLMLSSTRYPAHRIVSMFLFTRQFRDSDTGIDGKLERYVNNMNPWELYNYHTGEFRTGTCPMTEDEKRRVFSAVSVYDIVIDANMPDASNKILNYFNVFKLPVINDPADRPKERGTVRINLTDSVRNALKDKTCVEDALHTALQIKMAWLYEQATGETCLFDPRLPTLDTCIQREEKQTLKNYWSL